ncbi:MAG TPA: hypothetical protein PKJ75_07890 [Methanosarcina vacuolata]|nr:hypothetical protein [Methanosarcina vacuolata]
MILSVASSLTAILVAGSLETRVIPELLEEFESSFPVSELSLSALIVSELSVPELSLSELVLSEV